MEPAGGRRIRFAAVEDPWDPLPTSQPRRGLIVAGVVAVVVILAGAGIAYWQLSDDDDVRADEATSTTTTSAVTTTEDSVETTTTVPDQCAALEDRTWVAAGRLEGEASDISVYDQANGQVVNTVKNPWRVAPDGSTSSPAVFVVKGEDDPRDNKWLHVDLPIAPNGSEGYILAQDVEISCIAYRITVNREDFTLTLTLEGEPVFEPFPVGLSRDPRATQAGSYFVTELVTPTDANGNPTTNGPYGTAAYGIDGYSDNPDIISRFPDTGGQVGIHGTNDPGSLPGRVSNGCIRLRNENVDQLQTTVPLGTPVDVI